MTRHFRDAAGNYIGGFDGVTRAVPGLGLVEFFPEIPAGAVEVAEPPADARQVWNGTAWVDTPALVTARAAAALQASDAGMVRVIEDMWAVVKAKTGATDADLPQSARDKLAARAAERAKL